MTSEKSQLKFAKSERTGELIGFVSRHSKTRKLMGVREDSRFGKQICVLSEDLKGTIEPNILYSVELKPMHNAKGYVVVAATPVLFQAHVETIIVPKTLYQVTVTFGNKDFLRSQGWKECYEPYNRRCIGNSQRTQGYQASGECNQRLSEPSTGFGTTHGI